MDTKNIKVNIFNQEYSLKTSDEDEAYIKSIALYLDQKLTEFNKIFPQLPFNKLSILTTLNIIDELKKSIPEKRETDNIQETTDTLPISLSTQEEFIKFLEKVRILISE